MSCRPSSTFLPAPDSVDATSDNRIGFLMIGAVSSVAFFSAGAEVLSAIGFPIPHVITMGVGILVGTCIGICAANIIHDQKRDN